MSAMPFAMPPLRHALALSAAATLVAAAAFAMTTAAPSAHAESGRRLCMYVNGERNNDQKTTRYVVVDYKKDGACPPINRDTHPTMNSFANPVPKLTCEEVSADVEYESKYYGDLCELLTDDIVYGLVKHDGKPLHATEDVVNYGKVSNFR